MEKIKEILQEWFAGGECIDGTISGAEKEITTYIIGEVSKLKQKEPLVWRNWKMTVDTRHPHHFYNQAIQDVEKMLKGEK